MDDTSPSGAAAMVAEGLNQWSAGFGYRQEALLQA
jgi:hypothetical protein